MVKYTQIHKSIVEKLESKFADITIESNDISEGFTRPSFFINMDNIKSTDFMRQAQDRDITVRIYYFSRKIDNNKIELLNMQDELTELFLVNNIIKVDEYVNLEVDELDFDTVDKVLRCDFNIRLSEDYNRIDNTPLMEELEVDI